MSLSFELDGQPSGTPVNAQELSLSANWETGEGQEESEISLTSIEFAMEDAKLLNQKVADGLTGGAGIFEGVPYKIKLNSTTIFDGMVDLTNEATFVDCEKVIAEIMKEDGVDWLSEVADGISFGSMAKNNQIVASDYIVVPYVLNFRPEAFVVGQLLITSFLLTKELIQGIKDIAFLTADVVNAIGSIKGVIVATIRLVAQIIYTTAIVLALISVIRDLIEQFFPAVRRYNGMTFKRMFEVGLASLGLTFQSTIFNSLPFSNASFLPSKSEKGGIGGSANGVGHPNINSSIYNFGDFIRQMLQVFNADYKIVNGVFIFERRDYWKGSSSYVLPDVETNQSKRLSEFTYNTSEFVKNYFISFQTDIQDQNTLENFKGNNYQIISEPITIVNTKNILGKGLTSIRPPFARAYRKNNLTDYEKLLLDVAKQTDKIANFFGQNSNMASKITNRVGMMQLSDDTTTVDKFIFISNGQMATNQITAKMLWDKFHFIESFAEIVDPATGLKIHNQSIIENAEKIPFCHADWKAILLNREFTTPNGQNGLILSVDWDFQNQVANIRYKISKLYTKNIILVPNEGE